MTRQLALDTQRIVGIEVHKYSLGVKHIRRDILSSLWDDLQKGHATENREKECAGIYWTAQGDPSLAAEQTRPRKLWVEQHKLWST